MTCFFVSGLRKAKKIKSTFKDQIFLKITAMIVSCLKYLILLNISFNNQQKYNKNNQGIFFQLNGNIIKIF